MVQPKNPLYLLFLLLCIIFLLLVAHFPCCFTIRTPYNYIISEFSVSILFLTVEMLGL